MPHRSRVLAGLLLGAGGITLLSLPLGGWSDFLELAPQLGALPDQGDYPVHLQYSLRGLGLRLGLPWFGWLAAGVVIVLSCWRGQGRLPAALAGATLVNPHLHHYDALPVLLAVAVIGRWWVIVPFSLAFVVSEAFGLGSPLPLPTLAMLGVWALSVFGDYARPLASGASTGSRTDTPADRHPDG